MLRVFSFVLFGLLINANIYAGVFDKLNPFKSCVQPSVASIKVLILHDKECADLQVTGKYSIYDPFCNKHISSRYVGKSRPLKACSDGLKWGESFPGTYQLKLVPDEKCSCIVINGNCVDGNVFIYDIGGSISIVNQLPIENYINHLLATFPECNLHPEVLAAIAIAVRTNAYYMSVYPQSNFWAVDGAALGYSSEKFAPEAVYKAIVSTSGMIMSRTGVYDGQATPFLAQFDWVTPAVGSQNILQAKISIAEANSMAEKGAHAAQILDKAFPGMVIMLVQS